MDLKAKEPVSPVAYNGEVTRAMRVLSRHGVTHFAVTDMLYQKFKREANERFALAPIDYADDAEEQLNKPLLFQGKRLLRQSDIDVLEWHWAGCVVDYQI